MSDHLDVIVVGAGQAGLAIGHFLAAQGRDFAILEAADAPAAAWRARWDSLRLFTPAGRDSLPGLPFPGDPKRYPTRDEVVDYLTGYAEHFALPVRCGTRVDAVERRGAAYVVAAGGEELTADQVVLATGPFQRPRVPGFAAGLGAGVPQVHSSDYRSPAQLPDGPVLVVGGGNTGLQIAEELVASREVHLAVGSRQLPLPQRLLGRDIFDLLTALGVFRVTAESRLGRRLSGRETLIGTTPRALAGRGVALRSRAVAADAGAVRFADGTSLAPAAVIWATGFDRDFSLLRVPVLDERGAPVHRRGVTGAPGLYVLGMPWQHTRGSALLGWVGADAAYLAERIAAHAAARLHDPSAGAPVAA
jgi:putative flavoprotein involved in K+ transport